jgi:hypothetical protein
MRALLLTSVVAMLLGTADASVAEVCRFAGTTDHAGQVAITTDVSATNSTIRVDVAATFESTTMIWFHVHYLVEEISIWRAGELETVAVNIRYLVGTRIIRQQWDTFQRDKDAMRAHRVQAKTLADFRRRHPGFVRHWDPATFGQPWLDDYQAASPERRADLDLTGAPPSPKLRSPLALAFYWVRWLPPGGQDVAVFLPGFKADRLLDLPITAAGWTGGTLWQVPLRYPALSERPASTATAWTSRDGHLLQFAFDLHEPRGSARGLIRQDGCEGAPVVPAKAAPRP